MIVRENGALFECLRERCKRTGSARCYESPNRLNFRITYVGSFTVLLVRALRPKFAQVSRAIIHRAAKSKKLPDPSNNYVSILNHKIANSDKEYAHSKFPKYVFRAQQTS